MRAIVTGANGDIGNDVVRHLLDQKFEVEALDFNFSNMDDLDNIKKHKIDFSAVDYADKLDEMINKPVDLFVHSAGIREIQSLLTLDLSSWMDVLNVNLTSAFILSQRLCQLAIRHQQALSIIYISSIAGLQGEPNRNAYCASKHGLLGLMKSIALEMGSHKIRANAIAPGIIETGLTRPYLSEPDTLAKIRSNIPLSGAWGEVNHVTQTVDFIFNNNYLNGSVITVDGGWMAGKRL